MLDSVVKLLVLYSVLVCSVLVCVGVGWCCSVLVCVGVGWCCSVLLHVGVVVCCCGLVL